MELIYRERGTGKTKELIGYCLEHNVPILAITARKVGSLIEKSLAYYGKVVQVVTLDDVLEGNFSKLAIDDVDMVLKHLLGTPVTIATLCND